MTALPRADRQFMRLIDIYYWRTALMIAANYMTKQYRNSFLGIFWTLMQPMTMVVVYSIIMPMIMRVNHEGYVLYIITSLPLWAYISACITGASITIVLHADTLKRCMISATIFPVADVLRNTYTYLIVFIATYIVALLFFTDFDPVVLLWPFYFIPVLITLMALSIGLAFLAPYLRDLGDLLTMAMTLMIWFTPVLYPITLVPERFRALMEWNPFYILIHPFQMLLFEHTVPSLEATLKLLGFMMLSVVCGYISYRKCRRNFVYYL